jgi:tight adherence protein C
MSLAMQGALLGLVLGAGLLLVMNRAPVLRQPSLDDRLAPYLRDAARPSRLLLVQRSVTPLTVVERVLAPVVGDAVRALERVLGGAASVRRRLEQSGRDRTVEEFRAEQVVWAAVGLLGAVVVGLLLSLDGGASPVLLLVLCLAGITTGVLVRDWWLTREVARREERMMVEFPTVAELLALAVTAGEGATGALDRVTTLSRGELSRELRRALADARAGASLVVALQGIVDRTSLPSLARFVDGIAVAVERGTPLADVMRAQAVDVREAGKRALLEAGGRKEIAMMVPVVFLVLPTTVVFALFPGFIGFRFAG